MSSVQQFLNPRLVQEQEVWADMRDTYEQALIDYCFDENNNNLNEKFQKNILALYKFYKACLGDDHEMVIYEATQVRNTAVDFLEELQELSINEESDVSEGDYLSTANDVQKRCDNVKFAENIHKRYFGEQEEVDDYDSDDVEAMAEAELNDPDGYFNVWEDNHRAWLESLSPEDRAFYENHQLENRQLL